METAVKIKLSEASEHAVALAELQGYQRTERMLVLLSKLDAGEITESEAKSTVLSWHMKI